MMVWSRMSGGPGEAAAEMGGTVSEMVEGFSPDLSSDDWHS